MALRSRQHHGQAPYRKPLFDRLIGEEAGSMTGARRGADQRALLLQSVLLDLQRLLNTRRGHSEMLDPATATVLDYGIPNFTPMNTQDDMERLGNLIANAISIFEPRLLSPRVTLQPMESRPDKVVGEIAGSVRVGGFVEDFSFPLSVDPQLGAAQVLPSPEETS